MQTREFLGEKAIALEAGPQPDRSPIAAEWSCYKQALARLLAEGHEGRWVLIKGDRIVGVWDQKEQAKAAALRDFLLEPCLIHQVRSQEPLLRVSPRLSQCL